MNNTDKKGQTLSALHTQSLIHDLRQIIDQARGHVAATANYALTMMYWHIGERINSEVLGNQRAEYGKQIVSQVAHQLQEEYGKKGFEERTIRRMMQFAQTFPNLQILSPLVSKLSWSHFLTVMTLKDELQREFYLTMAASEQWSKRTLQSKIDGMLYERTAISSKPDELIKKELVQLRDDNILSPDLVFKSPYFLEFTGLKGMYSEKSLEISLTNFGTAFGMGLLVVVFMVGQGYYVEPFIGVFGAVCGCIVSTRLMQYFVLREYPNFKDEDVRITLEADEKDKALEDKPIFQKVLDALLDGGRTGVDVGLAIIPGVLIISTLVMLLTFGPSASGAYTGAAYEGVELLPWLAGKVNFVFDWLFGFEDPHLVAFPITALGAVGAALGLIPNFIAAGWINGNAIAVFTAIGMCWSGYLSTHTAMLDTLGYRKLTSKAIIAHTIGGLVAAFIAHWIYVLYALMFV